MPRRPRQLAESEIYHALARGVNRDAIFLEDEDFERFLHALALTKEASGCSILAYCLMTNHVHLVIRTGPEPIGTVMKRLGVRYASWFNRKYGRVGHVFQDRFRSLPVEDDEYFVALLRYVWRNPVEAGLVGRPEDYRWSSRRLLGKFSHLIDGDELHAVGTLGLAADASLDIRRAALERAYPGVTFIVPDADRPATSNTEGLLRLTAQCLGLAEHDATLVNALVKGRGSMIARDRLFNRAAAAPASVRACILQGQPSLARLVTALAALVDSTLRSSS